MTILQTLSGKHLDLKSPAYEAICLEDIAHGLGNTCRFSGQCKEFYSVAQHSLICAANAPNEEVEWAALMHDASEAYICDLPRPLKNMMPQYRNIEALLQETIHMKYNVDTRCSVKILDDRTLATEVRDLIPQNKTSYWRTLSHIKPFEEKIIPMSSSTSAHMFLVRARFLRFKLQQKGKLPE